MDVTVPQVGNLKNREADVFFVVVRAAADVVAGSSCFLEGLLFRQSAFECEGFARAS